MSGYYAQTYTTEKAEQERRRAQRITDMFKALEQACGIRGKAATDSDGKRPPIPIESGHPIRTKAATLLIG